MKKHYSKQTKGDYSRNLVTSNSSLFTTRNIIQDFSFNDEEFRHAKIINKIFGTNKFIKVFLRLLFPSLFWGLFTALVPILFNTMINGFYQDSQIGNQLYLSVNYTSYLFSFLNPLICSFIFACFPAVANYIAIHNKKKLQETLRWSVYITLIVCIIGLIFEEIFATQIALALVWQFTPPVTGVDLVQTNYSVIIIRWLAFSSFFYLWLWLYVPTLSSMKNSRALFYSSVIGFIYFIISYPSYLHSTYVNVGSGTLATPDIQDHLYGIINGIGGIYLGYFIIQPLFLLIYCYWPREFKVAEAWFINIFIYFWNGINRFSKDYQIATRKRVQQFPKNYLVHSTTKEEYTDYERDLLFFQTGFSVSAILLKQIFILAWVILLDQIFYAVLNLILMVYGTNYHGYWNGWNGIPPTHDAKLNLHMAKEYYKLILANVSLISTYIFTIYSGFSLLPQYFVGYYIGFGDKQTAFHNSTILTNWSILFGLFIAIIIIIYGSFINELIYSTSDPNNFYYFVYHGKKVALGTYKQLWSDAFNMELIYALAVLFDTSVAMTYYILLSGGSKFIIFADSLIQLINSLALIGLYYTNYDNFYVYYLVNRIHTFLKFFISLVVIYAKGALWGVDSTHNKKGWFKQRIKHRELNFIA